MGTAVQVGDGGGKLYFLLLKLIKRKKAQFWAKCLNSFCRQISESKSTYCCPISSRRGGDNNYLRLLYLPGRFSENR